MDVEFEVKAEQIFLIVCFALVTIYMIFFFLPSIGISTFESLAFVVYFSIVIILRLSCRRFIPTQKHQRQTLTEFTDILNEHVTLAGYGDDSNIKSTTAIRDQLRKDIAEGGWGKIRKKFTKVVQDAFGTQWYSENLFLVKILEIEEYLGYENSILDILKGIHSSASIDELRKQVSSLLMPNLRAQIQNGGNTTFLDVDKMKDEESARLVPILLEKRREHFLAAMEKYRSSQRDVNDLSDVLATNYGFNIVKAIKKEIVSPKAVGYIVTQLDSVYETLVQDRGNENTSATIERPRTPWLKLSREIAMAHIARLVEVKFDVLFSYCNPSLNTLYESGYRDIFKVLKELQSYPKLYKGEYKFILEVLKGIKTKRASETLYLLKMNDWKEKYLQS